MPRHACLGATSACAFSPSPPTHHASPPSPSPCLLLVHVPTPFATHSHTAKPHHHATHTHAWWLVHFGAWCVCVPTVLAVAAPGSPLTRPPTPCAPHHTTPPLAAAAGGGGGCGGGSVGVVACVATWSTHWLCWCCPLPNHTHTHGVMGTWWWWLCVWCGCHHHCAPFPPTTTTVCAAPPCPLCECVSGGTTHTRPLWCHPRWCVCVSERRGHHTHHPRCRPMCPLSPLTRHATPATLSQMPRLTSLTHMACFVWLLPSTHTHWLADCPHALHTPPPLGVRVLIHLLSSATHTHTRDAQAWPMHGWLLVWSPPPRPLCPTITHTHTQRDWWCGPWWCLVVRVCPVCASHATITLAFPPTTTTNALVPPPPSHSHTGLGACTTATHTPHAPPHTPRRAVC